MQHWADAFSRAHDLQRSRAALATDMRSGHMAAAKPYWDKPQGELIQPSVSSGSFTGARYRYHFSTLLWQLSPARN